MRSAFRGWQEVTSHLHDLAAGTQIELNKGQRASLLAIAGRIKRNGVIIADEVGMGKTRIAAAVAKCVIKAGGRVAILVPPGLGFQWRDELRGVNIDTPLILRSLRQYLSAWESRQSQTPWFEQNAVLISHAFTNWRLGDSSAAWRWALLPELYARWRKRMEGRFPWGYRGHPLLQDICVRNAAESIELAVSASATRDVSRRLIQKLADETPWLTALDSSKYGRNAQLRPWLEQAVGLGLGVYDLVITDEAHKSRGLDSGLNRLLENVVLHSSNTRRLAMTATPVELDPEQWVQILGRIQVDGGLVSDMILRYADTVRRVRQCPSDEQIRAAYYAASNAFAVALKPYLLRRDKRTDSTVAAFQNYSGEGFYAYRREQEILVETVHLSDAWKQAVCAAEALSFVTHKIDRSISKRLRLTIGNGHGVAALIDQNHRNEADDQDLDEDGDITQLPVFGDSNPTRRTDKRVRRMEWWQQVMLRASKGATSGHVALYDHPAVLAAVAAIEKVCLRDEKVLVFGRFTRPLRSLVELLNARAMLRSVHTNQLWPQSKVHENEWAAVEAAHRQLQRPGVLILAELDQILDKQYRRLEEQRRQTREVLLQQIEKGLDQLSVSPSVMALFEACRDACKVGSTHSEPLLAVVAKAIQDLVGPTNEAPHTTEYARAFVDLIEALSDRGEGDADGDGNLDAAEASVIWADLELRLRDEYSRRESGYARLMHGATTNETRRLLQLAFNRRHGYPKVLVTQSMVGREGLNLHKACRTVVLLHPEWNPGVVEQQIGRVDRIGSLWESKLEEAIANSVAGADLPRIEICPVVFQGTYDEKNWQVLRERWDDLRAQLHGVVISPAIAKKYAADRDMIDKVNAAAPDFSPVSNEPS